jgi:hypothetical protein
LQNCQKHAYPSPGSKANNGKVHIFYMAYKIRAAFNLSLKLWV